jgi:hypothetical protein
MSKKRKSGTYITTKNTKKDNRSKSQFVGWDSALQLYYVVFYGYYKNTKENLQKNPKSLLGKGGRTKSDVYVASKQACPIRGRDTKITQLWGFKKDRWYLPDSITLLKEAEQFVDKVDRHFKTLMGPYTIYEGSGQLGTEWYKLGIKDGVNNWDDWGKFVRERQIEAWDAVHQIYNKDFNEINVKNKVISYRGNGQRLHIPTLNKNSKGKGVFRGWIDSPMGSGKTFYMWLALNKFKRIVDNICVTIVAPKIKPTIQDTLEHLMFSKGTQYEDNHKTVAVCSSNSASDRNKLMEFGADLVSVSSNKLDEYLKDCFRNNIKYRFYVCVASYEEFLVKYNKYKVKGHKLSQLMDEIHRYTGNISSRFLSPIRTITKRGKKEIIKPIDIDCNLGYTANAKKVDGKNALGMESIEYYGKCLQRISLSETIKEGSNSNIRFVVNQVNPNNEDLTKLFYDNKKINISYSNSLSAPSNSYLLFGMTGVAGLVKRKVSHIYVNTSQTSFAKNLVKHLLKMQKDGKLSKKYKIMIGLRKDGTTPFEQFSEAKFAIIVSTRFSIESLNYPPIKGIVLTHFFNSIIDGYQAWGRGLRPYMHKDCYVSIPVFGTQIKQNPYIWLMNRVLLNEPIEEYNEVDYTEIKAWDINDLENIDPIDGGYEKVKPQVEVDKDETNTPAENIHIDTILSQITSEDFGGILKGSGRVYAFTEEEIFASVQKKDKKGNYIYKTPAQWRIGEQTIAWHTMNRTRFSEGKDDIWVRATAHMEHRVTRSLSQFEQILKDAEPFIGKQWAFTDFNSKYPTHINWIKYNPKSKQPIKYNGKVIDMNMLPFSAGKLGHLTKEYVESQMKGCECMTDLSKKLGVPNSLGNIRTKCQKLGIDYSFLEKTASERAIMANKRAGKITEKLTHQFQSISSIKKEILNMGLSGRWDVAKVVVGRTYTILKESGWIDKHFPKIISNQFLKAAKKK